MLLASITASTIFELQNSRASFFVSYLLKKVEVEAVLENRGFRMGGGTLFTVGGTEF